MHVFYIILLCVSAILIPGGITAAIVGIVIKHFIVFLCGLGAVFYGAILFAFIRRTNQGVSELYGSDISSQLQNDQAYGITKNEATNTSV